MNAKSKKILPLVMALLFGVGLVAAQWVYWRAHVGTSVSIQGLTGYILDPSSSGAGHYSDKYFSKTSLEGQSLKTCTVFGASGDATQDWQNCVVISIATQNLDSSKDIYMRVKVTGAPINTTWSVDVYYISAWESSVDHTRYYYPWVAGTYNNSTGFIITSAKRGEAVYESLLLGGKPAAETDAVCNGMLLKFSFNTGAVNPEIVPFGSYPVNIEITLGPN